MCLGGRVRSFGHATTETWVATAWDRFTKLARSLKNQAFARADRKA